MKFLALCPKGGGFWLPVLSRGVFVHNDCPKGKGFCSFQVLSQEFVLGEDGLDEIDMGLTKQSGSEWDGVS